MALIAPVADRPVVGLLAPKCEWKDRPMRIQKRDLTQYRMTIERVHDHGSATGFERRRLPAEREQVRRGRIRFRIEREHRERYREEIHDIDTFRSRLEKCT